MKKIITVIVVLAAALVTVACSKLPFISVDSSQSLVETSAESMDFNAYINIEKGFSVAHPTNFELVDNQLTDEQINFLREKTNIDDNMINQIRSGVLTTLWLRKETDASGFTSNINVTAVELDDTGRKHLQNPKNVAEIQESLVEMFQVLDKFELVGEVTGEKIGANYVLQVAGKYTLEDMQVYMYQAIIPCEGWNYTITFTTTNSNIDEVFPEYHLMIESFKKI